jgi:ribosomal-protein-alanine N-acetyltransferase
LKTTCQKHGFGSWAVIGKEDHACMGWGGLNQHPGFVDLGCRFKKEYWDQGYATEAAIACMHYSFEIQGITEILGRVVHGNDAPVSVLKKLGMSFWKTEHCHGMVADYFRINMYIRFSVVDS